MWQINLITVGLKDDESWDEFIMKFSRPSVTKMALLGGTEMFIVFQILKIASLEKLLTVQSSGTFWSDNIAVSRKNKVV